jgi:hypothetical protein
VSGNLAPVIDLAGILLAAEPEPEPHPDLVAVQRPTSAQMTEAVMRLGLYPPRPLFEPVRLAEERW